MAERESIQRLMRNEIKHFVFAEIIEITERSPSVARELNWLIEKSETMTGEITWSHCMPVSPSARKAERE